MEDLGRARVTSGDKVHDNPGIYLHQAHALHGG